MDSQDETTAMTSDDRFRQLENLFHELESLDAHARAERLKRLATEDSELHAELLAMLSPSTGMADGERRLERLGLEGGLASSLSDAGEPEQIGPYALKRLLGAGGMGRVYLAEQEAPVRRTVALKLTRRGFDSEEAESRFRTERQALAVLDHPHIARVFDAGTHADGRPWFAMEYIDGVSIKQWAADKGLGLVDRIRLLLPVCEAVQHAHRKGLIHRDLKPSNILVIDDGGLGFPKVIDFGIARLVDMELNQHSRVTRVGELVGTPEYMSPEQAALGEIDIDTRSDIYSLGLVLHELLVGELPLSGRQLRALGFEAMCRMIREGETPRPSRFRPLEASSDTATLSWRTRLKGDLDAVLLKALAKDRERRYGTASELAEDLRRYLNNQPVLAQPPSLGYRAAKFVRRNRLPVGAGAVVLLALIAATIISSLGLIKARDAERLAVRSAQQAEFARLDAEENLARSEFFLTRATLQNRVQSTYSDVLQRMFGNEFDVEKQTRILLDRLDEVQSRRSEEVESAAYLSYAIGRHFMFRNDYPTALAVLEPWVLEAYGPPELLFLGRLLLPILYQALGRPDDAVPVLRELLIDFENGWEAYFPDHVAMATRLASITADDHDLAQAERVLARAMQSDHGPQINMYFANQMAIMRRLRGDLKGAHASLRELVTIIENNALMDIAGTDTGRLNLATFELYHAGNLGRAEELITTVLEQVGDRGESRESGRARELLGVLLAEQGRFNEALPLLEQAVDLTRRFGGDQSQALVFALASQAEALRDSGQPARAQAVIEAARQALPQQDTRALSATRIALAGAWLQPVGDSGQRTPEAAEWDVRWIETDPVLRSRYQKLIPM